MISGGIKFFNKSKCLSKDGSSASASSGTSTAEYILDQNAVSYWRSVGSTDLVTEEILIEFNDDIEITRLFLLEHNWKDFNIMYDLLGVWTHFASVRGLDGTKTNITETAFADSSAYYEFTSVTTGSIRIQVLKTQTANQQKYLSQLVCTTEIGTMQGYPEIDGTDFDRNSKSVKTISGRYSVQKGDETVGFSLKFKRYPINATYSADIDLIFTLQDMEDPFLVWLCGGKRGSSSFRYTLRGFRLKDLYQMQIVKALKAEYQDNVYVNPVNASVAFEEVI